MTELHNPGGWPGLRTVLAAAVSAGRTVEIRGAGEAVRADESILTLFNETARISEKLTGVRIGLSGDSVITDTISHENSGDRFGRASIECAPGIPVSEIILFLAPSLFRGRFRSALEISGTTHSGKFLPVTFIRDTLFDAAARFGFSAGINLEMFGFGSAGAGKLECRIYPSEPSPSDGWQGFEFRRLSKARVYFSDIPQQAAKAQKEYISRMAGLVPSSVSILDIMNAPGRHNSVYLNVTTEKYDLIFFREIGSFHTEDDPYKAAADSLSYIDDAVREAKDFVDSGRIPAILEREMIYYAIKSGSNAEPLHEENRGLAEALRRIG